MTKEEANAFMRAFCEKDAQEYEEHAIRLEKIGIPVGWSVNPSARQILESEIKHLREMARLRREMAKAFE